MRYILALSCLSSTLILSACSKRFLGGNNAENASNLTEITLGGISVDTLPWNADYKAKTKQEKEDLLTKIGFGFRLILKSTDAKCQSANLDTLKVGAYTIPEQTVTRGCSYDITLTFGATKEADKPAATTAPKEFLKTLLAPQGGTTSYKIPSDDSKPTVKLSVCPTNDSSAYFDTKICTATDPTLATDLNVQINIGNAEKKFALVRLKPSLPPCVVDSCKMVDKTEAQKTLDITVGPANCSFPDFVVPDLTCSDFPTNSPDAALQKLVTDGKAFKSGTKLP